MIRIAKNPGARTRAKNPERTLFIEQGQIGVSLNGHTAILSPGYCGCLGLILSAEKGGGGLVSHIAETGHSKGAVREDYILESVRLTLELAVKTLDSAAFYLAMFRGWPNETDWDLGLADDPRIKSKEDLRSLSHKSEYGSFLFDPRKRKVYIPGHAFKLDEGDDDKLFSAVDTLPTKRTELVIPLGRKPMPVIICE